MDAISRQPLARLSAPPGAFPVGALLLATGVVAGAAAAVLGLDRLPVAICYFKALSGLPCLSCGGTRAVAELARLDPAGALTMNPLATLAGLVLIPWGLGDLLLWTRGRALRLWVAPALRPALRWVLGAALVSNWVYLVAAGR